LIGFMGSGKSTLGALVAARFAVPFIDLDDRIEAAASRTVAEIFAGEGEPAFRRRELDALRALATNAPEPAVISTGGGIVETPAAAPLVRGLGRVVWLRADPAACVDRVGATSGDRPLLAGDWQVRWVRRRPLYESWADAVVSTHPESVNVSFAALAALAPFGPRSE
jgi:shikimate kinase